MKNLLKYAKISRVENAAAAGQTELKTSVLDMAGFDSVILIALLGDVTDTSVLGLSLLSNSANSDTGGTEAAAATFTAGASDADNKLLAVDVHRPAQRYVYGSLTRTTANAVVDGIIAIQYNSKDLPVEQAAELIASAFAVD